jgi:hypothetical protein
MVGNTNMNRLALPTLRLSPFLYAVSVIHFSDNQLISALAAPTYKHKKNWLVFYIGITVTKLG